MKTPETFDLEPVAAHMPRQRWRTLRTGDAENRGVFALQEIVRVSPRTGKEGVYQVLRVPDWVNVVALTPNDELILVEQYRHGTDAVTLEIPGGAVDDGEDPGEAATRELCEETGYTGDPPRRIGLVHPNPAIQDNACTTWLIENARATDELRLDDGEDIRVVAVPRLEIPELVRAERITHSLVIAAFYWLDQRG